MFKGASGFHAGEVGGAPPVGTGGIYGGSGSVPTSVTATIFDTLTFSGGDVIMAGSDKLGFGGGVTEAIYKTAGGILQIESGGTTHIEVGGDLTTNSEGIEFRTGGAFFGLLATDTPTADRTFTLPDASGTIVVGSGFITLTDAATITWDYLDGSNAEVTLTATRTLDTPSNVSDGDYGTLKIIQGGVGGWGLTLPLTFQVVNDGGGTVTLSTGVGAVDIICWVYDGTSFWVTIGLNFTGP